MKTIALFLCITTMSYAFEAEDHLTDRSQEWEVLDSIGLHSLEQPYAGCAMVVSPPAGHLAPGPYDVIGWFMNLGPNIETFYATANVYDTIGMVMIFTQTINLTLAAGADTHLYFGQVTFGPDGHFYTEIYPMLPPDINPVDTSSSGYSWTTFLGSAERETSTKSSYQATIIFTEPLQILQGTKCRVYDITGRVVVPTTITRGIYFIEVDGVVTQKVVKVR